METVFAGLVTAFGDMVTDTLAGFVSILPVVLPILGTTIGVAYVVKWVKKLTK